MFLVSFISGRHYISFFKIYKYICFESVLEDSGFNTINSLVVQNPFNIKSFKDDKISVLDIRAMDKNNNVYNIEIQSSGNRHFRNRSLYYWSKLYSSEIKEADDYRKLNPVICINILDFNLFTESDKIHNCFLLREKDRGFALTNHQVIHFIELSKTQNDSISGHLDQWIVYLQYEGRTDKPSVDIVEKVVAMNPDIKSTHKRYVKFSNSEELREVYEARIKYQRDVSTMIEGSREEGREEGIQTTLIRLINQKFELTDSEKDLIFTVKDSAIINEALDIILSAQNKEDVLILFRK